MSNKYIDFMEELRNDINILKDVVQANPKPDIPVSDFLLMCGTYTVLLGIEASIILKTSSIDDYNEKYNEIQNYLKNEYKNVQENNIDIDDLLKPIHCGCIESLYNKIKEEYKDE